MEEPTNKLFIGNLNYSVDSNQLQEHLSQKQKVTECRVIEGKGIAFVSFETTEAATAILNEFKDTEFQGRTLKMDYAKPVQPRRDNRDRQRSRY